MPTLGTIPNEPSRSTWCWFQNRLSGSGFEPAVTEALPDADPTKRPNALQTWKARPALSCHITCTMLHASVRQPSGAPMPVGRSGRIVVEIDPELKQELYAALDHDGISLKQWFLDNAGEYLRDRGQLSLDLMVADGNNEDRRYR